MKIKRLLALCRSHLHLPRRDDTIIIDALREEYDALVMARKTELYKIEEWRNTLDKRIEALAPYIRNDFPDEVYDSTELRSMMDDSKKLLTTLGFLTGIYYPKFVIELQRLGLSELEIGYCCLYGFGYRGKEISASLNRDSFYKANQVIRRKVGLGPHDTNLSIWARKLFMESKEDSGRDLRARL